MLVFTSKKNEVDTTTNTTISITSSSTSSNNNNHDSNYNSVKILHLSKEMKVETKYISKRHGHSISILDTIENTKTFTANNITEDPCNNDQKVICTLLPVRLHSQYFRDEEFSQLITSKKFKKIRHTLFGASTSSMDTAMAKMNSSYGDSNNGILRDTSNEDEHTFICNEQQQGQEFNYKHPDTEIVHVPSSLSTWPSCMPQIAPEQQNTTAICLQFALDAACHL